MLGRLRGNTSNIHAASAKLLVDPDWYKAQNPDIADLDVDPAEHFASNGLYEGRDPSLHFSSDWYMQQNPDLAEAGVIPCVHFLESGGLEGRSPNPLFNAHWYLETYQDVKELGMNPLLHFLQSGADEGRNPCPLFSTSWYVENNPEIAETQINPLLHYLTRGASANFDPHPLFSAKYYTSLVSGSSARDFNPLVHYIMAGPMSDANPHPLFNQKWYRERSPEIIEKNETPLEHYLTIGAKDGKNPHQLFLTWWYAEQYLSGDASKLSSLEHFITTGMARDNQPNPYFTTSWYKNTYLKDSVEPVSNPILHYLENCEQTKKRIINNTPVGEYCNPNPWFDTAWYFVEHPDILHTETDPLSHYTEAGALENRSPGPHFNPQWYTTVYDIGAMTPLEHFLSAGAIQGHAPNPLWQKIKEQTLEGAEVEVSYDEKGNPNVDPRQYQTLKDSDLFDAEWYRQEYLVQNNNPMDPIEHYLIFGAHLGYNPSTKFSSSAYRSINHDLRSATINPLLHYIQHGRFEGRHAQKEKRDNEVQNFRFSKPEYGPITDVLVYDSDIQPPETLDETICLHLHLFHTDMAEEFCEMLNRLTLPFVLLVSIQPNEDETHWTRYFIENITFAKSVNVKCCPNRGRDVQPWLVTFKEDIQQHDIFCHIHTKKSGYNKFQKSWRRYLTHTTFGKKTLVNQILNLFADDKNVGLVFPAYFYILRNQPNFGKNYDQYERLYMMLFGDIPQEKCSDYPAGSFFWARTSMLQPLFDLDLQVEDFDKEDGQVDGTVAHALERILGSLPTITGHQVRCIAVDVPFDLTRYVHPARVDHLNKELLAQTATTVRRERQAQHHNPKRHKIAAYSAITGGYENYVKPLVIDPDIDYYLFTDTPEKFDPDWATVIHIPYVNHKPVRTARYAKTHPHFWFPEYDYAVWMDANVLPTTSIHPFIEKLHNSPFHAAFIEHPLRYNCMEEGQELIKFGLDDQSLIEEQLTRYGRIPEIFAQALIETNFFICRPKLAITKDFMTLWWKELNNYSHRDQLSIGYALLKSRVNWMPLFEDNISIRDHRSFFLLEHEMHNRDVFMNNVTTAIDNSEQNREAI